MKLVGDRRLSGARFSAAGLLRLLPLVTMRVLALLCLLLAAATAVRVGVSTPRAAAATRPTCCPFRSLRRARAAARRARRRQADKKFESVSHSASTSRRRSQRALQVEVVSRSEAMASCKQKCATSKDQLLNGQPKK